MSVFTSLDSARQHFDAKVAAGEKKPGAVYEASVGGATVYIIAGGAGKARKAAAEHFSMTFRPVHSGPRKPRSKPTLESKLAKLSPEERKEALRLLQTERTKPTAGSKKAGAA